MEFRSDGSILEQGVKADLLTWHSDYLCLNTKKIRDAQAESKQQNTSNNCLTMLSNRISSYVTILAQ